MTIFAFAQKAAQDVAVRGRLALGSFLASDGALKSRSGFLDPADGAVTVVATTMDVSVAAARLIVEGSAAGQGAYPVVNTGAASVTLPDGGVSATLYHIGFLVQDSDFDASGTQDATLAVWPAVTPPVGTVFPIREITVPAGKNAGNGGLVPGDLGADLRQFTAGAGGVVPVTGAAQRDAWVDARLGQLIWRLDLNRLECLADSGWGVVFSDEPITSDWVAFVPTMTAGWDTGTWAYRIHGNGLVTLKAEFLRNGSTISASSEGNLADQTIVAATIPAEIRPSEVQYIVAKQGLLTGASTGYIGVCLGTDGSFKLTDAAPGLDITNNSPVSTRFTYSR